MSEVLDRLQELWASGVNDPGNRDKISDLFIENGFPEHSPYKNQPGAEYCGHTAAHGFRGILPDDFLHGIFASTTRLFGRGPKTWDAYGLHREDHEIDNPNEIRPGDLVVVVTSGRKAWGDHITVAGSKPAPNGKFWTYEGNAHGIRGDGTWGKGVVQRLRSLGDVRQIYRF